MLTDLNKSVENLKKNISKNNSVNINSQNLKTETVDIAKEYFSTHRHYIVEKNLDPESIVDLDNNFQEILRLTQGNNKKSRYLTRIKKAEKIIKDLIVKDVSSIKVEIKKHHTDELILNTLQAIVPTAALSYEQAVIDLNINTGKISYRGTAAELREALRETLDHLAPDSDVTKMSGFKLEHDQTKPTMKQKVRYILRSRNLNDTKRIPAEKSVEAIEEIIGQMARAVYNRASLSTHIQTSKQEVLQIKRYIDIVFHEVLELG